MMKRSLFLLASLVLGCGGGQSPAEPTPAPAAGPEAKPAPSSKVAPDPAQGGRDGELTELAMRIIEAYANHSAVLSPDGKQLAFVSTRAGLNQLYLADAARPDSPATRLVETGERCHAPRFTPDGRAVVFISDRGADEFYSIFRVDLATKAVTELTPGARLRRSPPIVPDMAGGDMFFTAGKVEDRQVHVYRAGTGAAGEAKLVYTDPGPGGLMAVSRDGKQALVSRAQSLSDGQLFLVDTAAGTAKQIYPAEGKSANILSAAFTADGKRVLLTTDEGGEKAVLLALDPDGRERARYTETRPATAQLGGIEVAPRGNRLSLLVDAGNHTEVRILDARTLKPRAAPKLPLGAGGTGPFSADGKRFTLTWTTPDEPVDVHVVDAGSGRAKPLRKDDRPTLAGLGKLEAKITEVKSFDGTAVPVNQYLPAQRSGKLPVVVIVHGGPAAASTVDFNPWARFFTGQGYAVIEPNVRGSTGFGRAYEQGDNGKKRMDAVKDMEAVGRWAVAQPWCDGRAILFGGSYGGYMTLMGLVHQTDLWKAGVDLVGPSNLISFMATTTAEIRTIFLEEFGDPEKDREFLMSISPIGKIDKIVAPLFIYQGANDPRVPQAESEQVVSALRKRGVPVEYMLVMNEGHSLEHKENHAAFLGRAARFLETELARK
ncbi:MAG TPA: S9 family peptidase [Kofleriaceae bacterium]|nr:S9 family peptidase [Kofleriaceae bacterium]